MLEVKVQMDILRPNCSEEREANEVCFEMNETSCNYSVGYSSPQCDRVI